MSLCLYVVVFICDCVHMSLCLYVIVFICHCVYMSLCSYVVVFICDCVYMSCLYVVVFICRCVLCDVLASGTAIHSGDGRLEDDRSYPVNGCRISCHCVLPHKAMIASIISHLFQQRHAAQ